RHLRESHGDRRKSYVQNPHKRPMGKGYDLIGLRKDGTSVAVEISLNYFKEGGEMMVMALIMDVTVRKEHEAQIMMLNKTLEKRVEQRTRELQESQTLYRLIARNYPNGTINVFDRDLNYVFVEGQDLYKTGVTSDHLMGKNYLSQLPEAIRPEMKARLESVLGGENISFEMDHQNQQYLINAVGLADKSGHINRILLVEQNITEQKQAEQKVLEALNKEKELNELKSRFVSMASHEFRTPLSTVLSSLSLIQKYDEQGDQDKKDKHYQRIKGSVRHLTGILNDFLSLEKVESGKVSVHKSDFDVQQIATEIVEQLQDTAKVGQRIHFEYSGASLINTDQNILRIILNNLLSNAIKYSEEGKNIWLNMNVSGNLLRITIKDEGIGIPYEDQPNMFARFFRAKNALNLEGTGLGLNIVHRYLQMLGGKIRLESAPMEGTTFFVEIQIDAHG
ncbi:MAG: PAS domain-containing sensor histidine kinase, partial [Flavobacteriales bacterium]